MVRTACSDVIAEETKMKSLFYFSEIIIITDELSFLEQQQFQLKNRYLFKMIIHLN